MDPLSKATPKANVLLWKAGSALYALIILINQNVELLSSLGISDIVANRVKIGGIFIYALFTYFNFSQTTYMVEKTPVLEPEPEPEV